jgi:hypothetical protein
VFLISKVVVIAPTPPGTGVTKAVVSIASSKQTSPVILLFTEDVPTSMTTAPSFTNSPVIKPGFPTMLLLPITTVCLPSLLTPVLLISSSALCGIQRIKHFSSSPLGKNTSISLYSLLFYQALHLRKGLTYLLNTF